VPLVPPKMRSEVWNLKTRPQAHGTAKNEFGVQNLKIKPDALDIVKKWVQERETWNLDPTPSIPSKMSPGAQNLKTRPNAPDNAENESGSTELENWIRGHRYRRKWVWWHRTWKLDPVPHVALKMSSGAQNLKTRHDTYGIAENKSESTKLEK
jgi:hypothetical protein